MAIELLRSETLSSKRAELVYLITEQTSAANAKTLLLSTAPSSHNSLPRRDTEATVSEEEPGESSSDQTYLGRVPYGTGGGQQSDLAVGDTRITISAAGGSIHITQSLETIATYGDAEDHEGAIGVDHEGNIAGTEIFNGGFDFTITKIVASNALTSAYLNTLLELCTPEPKTNNETFTHTDSDGRVISLAAGEALFMGFATAPRGNGEDELRLNFKGSANLKDALPNTDWTIAKKGFEHLWVRYRRDVDGAANKLVSKPVSAYVERIYEEGAFSGLAL